MKKKRLLSAFCAACIGVSALNVPTACLSVNAATANNTAFNNTAGMTVEYLDRGICAVNTGSGMLVNWRFLATDPDNAIFKLYRDNTLIYTRQKRRMVRLVSSTSPAMQTLLTKLRHTTEHSS